jgi:hypothetical protein
VDTVNAALGALLRGYFAVFAWAHPLVGLALLSALVGVAMLWLFARASNQPAIVRTKRRVYAHLMELRLFADDPVLMFRAQGRLLAANARYLGLMLVPALAIAVPVVALLVRLDAFYGRAPLAVGADALVTVEMRGGGGVSARAPHLEAPEGIAVETPAVRVSGERQVVWRIRALRPVSGRLTIKFAEGAVEKRIETGAGFRFVPGRRVSSLLAALWYPDEPRLTHPAVEWIDIDYPPAGLVFLGLDWHWLIWFTLISMATALALRKRFRVVL